MASFIVGLRCSISTIPTAIVKGDCKLGRRVGVLRWYSECHQVLWDDFNAISFTLGYDCMAII